MRQDRWVASRLGHLGASGVCVELGANDGHAGSNTAWFDHVGSFSGVCIEPFHDNFERLRKWRIEFEKRAGREVTQADLLLADDGIRKTARRLGLI